MEAVAQRQESVRLSLPATRCETRLRNFTIKQVAVDGKPQSRNMWHLKGRKIFASQLGAGRDQSSYKGLSMADMDWSRYWPR